MFPVFSSLNSQKNDNIQCGQQYDTCTFTQHRKYKSRTFLESNWSVSTQSLKKLSPFYDLLFPLLVIYPKGEISLKDVYKDIQRRAV